jgi:hypothetical protein
VFALVDETAGGRRHLVPEPPDDAADQARIAYVVDRRGGVRYGPAGRAAPPTAGAALVRDAARIDPAELALVRDVALAAGATAFVAAAAGAESAPRLAFAPPADGSLRYAVRPDGTLLVGDAALGEPPRRIGDATWETRTGGAIRLLRRLRERGEALGVLDVVGARDWARLERLVPERERATLHPRRMVGLAGPAAAESVTAAIERELGRLRAEAARLLGA